MATNTTTDSGAGDLFQRKATGLLRGWSVWDGFIYAAFSINLITLGLFIFSQTPFLPDGSLIWAIVLAGLYLVFQAVTYASLIAVMPRAGGDYVWTSRVLGGGIGFVLAVTAWPAFSAGTPGCSPPVLSSRSSPRCTSRSGCGPTPASRSSASTGAWWG